MNLKDEIEAATAKPVEPTKDVPPKPRNRGLAAKVRSIEPGYSVVVEGTRVAINVAAWRAFGRGNYSVSADGTGFRVWNMTGRMR